MLNGKRMLLLSLAVLAGVGIARLPAALAQTGSLYRWTDPVTDVLLGINDHFFRETKLDQLQQGAIRGMIDTLDDPYTEFIPNKEIKEFDKQVRGEFVGIGCEIRADNNWLLIVSPLDDSPAYKAGIEADDLVIAAGGVTTFNKSVDQCIDLLTGEPGSVVRLTIERKGEEKDKPAGALPVQEVKREENAPEPAPVKAGNIRFDLNVTRAKILTSTVKGIHRDPATQEWEFMADPVKKVGYIRVTQFTEGTVPELKAACQKLLSQGMKGLVLDLRFNGGGSLDAAEQMADMFLSEGLIVSTKGRKSPEEKYFAHKDGTLPDFPMAILLNESSASASEVFSGALADNKRAVIVGTRSFGKGIVQSVFRLPSGEGQLKVTEAYYYLPSGRCLHRTPDSTEWGVDPTPGFYVPATISEQRDFVRLRRLEEIIHAPGKAEAAVPQHWDDPSWILDHLKDKQLSSAVKAVQVRLDSGEWAPTGGDAPKGTLELAALQRETKRMELLLREVDKAQKRIDALSTVADANKAKPEIIPGDPDLTGGKLLVYDKDGKVVTTLKITGPDLERWLLDAPVETDNPIGEPKK